MAPLSVCVCFAACGVKVMLSNMSASYKYVAADELTEKDDIMPIKL